MRIAMMGSGGVGGYFGARLQQGGADVTFIARGAHLAAMRAGGLTIKSAHAPIHLPKVKATDDPASIGQVDIVLLSVKRGTPRARRARSSRSSGRTPASSRCRTACRRMTCCGPCSAPTQ